MWWTKYYGVVGFLFKTVLLCWLSKRHMGWQDHRWKGLMLPFQTGKISTKEGALGQLVDFRITKKNPKLTVIYHWENSRKDFDSHLIALEHSHAKCPLDIRILICKSRLGSKSLQLLRSNILHKYPFSTHGYFQELLLL